MLARVCLAFGLAVSSFAVFAGGIPFITKPVAPDLVVEVSQPQQEIAVDVPESNAGAAGMQFGLLGALVGSVVESAIENSAAKKAESTVAPIRDVLIGYDFNARLEAQLRAKLPSEGLSNAPQFLFLSPAALAERAEKNAPRAAKALVLTPRYAMDNTLATLSVSITAQVIERDVSPRGKFRDFVRFTRVYKFNMPLDAASETNAKQWVDLGKPTLTALLDQGIAQSIDMLVFDFSDAGRAQWEQPNRGMETTLKGRRYHGMTLKSEPDFVWARTGKKLAQTIQGYQIVTGPISVDAPAADAPAVVAVPAAPAANDAQPVEAPAASPAAAGGSQ
ncbi:hypothetical protein LF41_2686 [Lysobacter dokdonensis DS-58]|uniref:Uncharacterized protein n=1 Tax=Lysobacter dokdonensis DS-58 TaxID=1300345 RepID=A0A0A2X3F4_9GAMM|nr:hypothetical protein [Lysobacter dokdonensis]KGQ19744.1 hypothetical protein LF41_2686 [Lysobacter dokdonensis DS-58]